VINNVIATTISANERYVRSTAVRLFIMFCEYMFSCYLFPFILLCSTSSMFELHVVVAGIVMFNILELIMEIVPNYPTVLTHFTQIPKFLLFVACCFFNGRVGVRGDRWRTSSLNGGGIEGVGSVGLERQSSVGGGSLTRGGDRVRGARGEFIVHLCSRHLIHQQ
jgi:hypothetical protein